MDMRQLFKIKAQELPVTLIYEISPFLASRGQISLWNEMIVIWACESLIPFNALPMPMGWVGQLKVSDYRKYFRAKINSKWS